MNIFLAVIRVFGKNMAESINLKASGKLPIVFLVQKTRTKIAFFFFRNAIWNENQIAPITPGLEEMEEKS